MKGFICGKRVAFAYLDRIYDKMLPLRMNFIQGLQFCNHTSDNYNAYHVHKVQDAGKPGVMHLSMVYNIVRVKEYLKPPGTLYMDVNGIVWVVVRSALIDQWTCAVTLRQTVGARVYCQPYQITIQTPETGWTVVSFPCQ